MENQCQGHTKSGERCRAKVGDGQRYCHLHKSQYPEEFTPQESPPPQPSGDPGYNPVYESVCEPSDVDSRQSHTCCCKEMMTKCRSIMILVAIFIALFSLMRLIGQKR